MTEALMMHGVRFAASGATVRTLVSKGCTVRTRVLGVGLAVFLVVALGACDWLQPYYDGGHSSYNPSESALTTSTVKTLTSQFTIATAGRTYGLPIVNGTNLYATSFESGTGTARIEQFDATNGTPGWSATLGTAVTSVSDVASASGLLFALAHTTGATTLQAVSTSDGTVAWTYTLPADASTVGSPVVDQGRVFVTIWLPGTVFPPWGSAEVIAVDATSGAVDWTYTGAPSAVSAVGTAVAGGNVIFSYDCCARPGVPEGYWTTDVVRETDGTALRSTTFDLLTVAQNSLAYGRIVDVGSGQTGTGALDPATGTVKWAQPVTSDFAVSGTSAVFVSSGVGVQAFDAKTGTPQWTSPASGDTTASGPVVAAGVVYLVTSNGTTATLRTYDAKTGVVLGSVTVPGTGGSGSPVVLNGRVYVPLGGTIAAYAPAES